MKRIIGLAIWLLIAMAQLVIALILTAGWWHIDRLSLLWLFILAVFQLAINTWILVTMAMSWKRHNLHNVASYAVVG